MEIRIIKGWTYLLTFGYSLDIYARGNKRRAVDRNTGEVKDEYTFKR